VLRKSSRKEKRMLTREQFLGSFVRTYRTVDTAIGPLRIQNLNEGEKAKWQDGNYDKDGKLISNWLGKSRRRLIVACLVDDNGAPLLEEKDAEKLKDVDAAVTAVLGDACSEHIGMTKGEQKELAKNSDEAPAAASPTA
jgi:hypothetical protein